MPQCKVFILRLFFVVIWTPFWKKGSNSNLLLNLTSEIRGASCTVQYSVTLISALGFDMRKVHSLPMVGIPSLV